MNAPSYDFIKKLSHYTENIYQEKLLEMSFEEYLEYVIDYKRSLLEVLFDFQIK